MCVLPYFCMQASSPDARPTGTDSVGGQKEAAATARAGPSADKAADARPTGTDNVGGQKEAAATARAGASADGAAVEDLKDTAAKKAAAPPKSQTATGAGAVVAAVC